MPKVEITEKGVYMATGEQGQAEQPVPVGTIVDTKTENVPAYLVGKCKIVGDAAGKVLQMNDLDVEALRAEYEQLFGEKAPGNMKPENLKKKIEETKAKQ